MTSFSTESFSRSFSKAGATAQHHNKPFKMENFFDMDAFSNFDLDMLFAEDENVLSYNLDNAVNTKNDEGTPSSSHFAEFSGVQLDNIPEQADSRRTKSKPNGV